MKIAVLAAMEKERRMLSPLLENKSIRTLGGLEVEFGKIGVHDVCVSKCGIGKVNSAINTYKIIEAFHPDLVINSGVAGGTGKRTRIGDLFVADYVAYHDVWCGPETAVGAADGLEVFMPCDESLIRTAYKLFEGKRLQVGLICSGDRFITTRKEIDEITMNFPEAIAVDMESASIGQVCTLEGVRFNIIRIISDTPGEGENISQYENFWKEAPKKNFTVIKEIINNL